MKQFLSRGLVALFPLFLAFLVVTAVSPLRFESDGRWFGPPCDFSLRMTELDCLKRGVDPFDVWHGDVKLKPFRPNFVGSADNLAEEEYPRLRKRSAGTSIPSIRRWI